LFAHGWWFSPGTPASSTTKTGRHDIAEILLKVGCQNVYPFVPFLLTLVLSVLRFTVSDYLFGIFELFCIKT
jgi:hypothetical protein